MGLPEGTGILSIETPGGPGSLGCFMETHLSEATVHISPEVYRCTSKKFLEKWSSKCI